jgi:hypothetical protein
VALTTHPIKPPPTLKKEYSYTSTPLWAFVACYRADSTFTFTFTLLALYMNSLPDLLKIYLFPLFAS